ncbi:MAG: hypothetical protein EOM83_03280 [Clostridia bacterium]|nr:hypothetical protein [Clostridia bacterium]
MSLLRLFRIQLLLMVLMTLFMNAAAQSPSGKYFVFLNTNPNRAELPKAEVDALQAAHMANIDSLTQARRMLAAGPFHGGGGMFVLAATSLQEAQSLIDSDPAVAAGRFVVEVFPLSMTIGGICQPPEKYEMAEYQFIRYVPVKEAMVELTEKKLEKLSRRHGTYLKANFYEHLLIADADFGAGKGGVLIAFNGDAEEFDRFLKYDPFVKSGLYRPVASILWIAQGTFCERKPDPKTDGQRR